MNAISRIGAAEFDIPTLWHIGLLVPGKSQRFIDWTKELKIRTYVPMEQRRVRCGTNKTREHRRPLLGPYAFIDFGNAAEEYHKLKEGFDFRGLMPCGDGYALVNDMVVEGLRLLEAKLAGTLSTSEFAARIGDLVRFRAERRIKLSNGQAIIEPTAFGGHIAKIKDVRYGERIRYLVEITLFGATRNVEADAAEFEPA